MYVSVFHFQGEPAALRAAHARMLAAIPPADLKLHFAVPRPDGLDVYDACLTRATFEAFSTSDGFRDLLAACGLPAPRIESLGDASCVVVQGRPVEEAHG
jgi:hypothetical protein